ncbi:MAG TPA: TetR family transcriptional regulator [Candidatus Limnocylindria bacterium]|nr:TetR family transcriptional regulator [Candidatus Limnocylindria bacterium]
MTRSGRRPGAAGTREQIAAAATEAFAAAGFDGATIRGIARQAGVDPALVRHYFGSKERLFVATMRLPFDPAQLAATLVSGGVDGIGERIMRVAVGVWSQPGLRPVVQGIARSAASDPQAAAILRGLLEATLLPAIRSLGVDRAELRASLLWSLVIGIVFGRFVVQVSPLAEADPEELVTLVAPALQAVLEERLGTPASARVDA